MNTQAIVDTHNAQITLFFTYVSSCIASFSLPYTTSPKNESRIHPVDYPPYPSYWWVVAYFLEVFMKTLQIGRHEEILLDRHEAALQIGVHPRTVQRWQQTGRLKSRRIGRRFYSTDAEILQSLDLTKRRY